MYLHSVKAIAYDIFDALDRNGSEWKKLRDVKVEDDLISIWMSWGISIRNHYGLWDKDHPLTHKWHVDHASRVMHDGVDYSKDHPDKISFNALVAVWKMVKAW